MTLPVRLRRFALALLLPLVAPAAGAQTAGAFDYYILALSWSPNWCAIGGNGDAAQCDPDRDIGWLLHGLWPQHERGYPADCPTTAPGPSPAQSAAMADIMGSAGLARYQWRKHGRCTGLTGAEYYRLARRAFAAVDRPAVLRQIGTPVRLPARVVEDAFLEANPALTAAQLTVTCRGDAIGEVRICLTRDLQPRRCGLDVARDCPRDDALMMPIP